jgi:hypothetical protein
MSQWCVYSSQGDYQCDNQKNTLEHYSDLQNNNVIEKFNKNTSVGKVFGNTKIKLTENDVTKEFTFDATDPNCWTSSGHSKRPYNMDSNTTCDGSWSQYPDLSDANNKKMQVLLDGDKNALRCKYLDTNSPYTTTGETAADENEFGQCEKFLQVSENDRDTYAPTMSGCTSNGENIDNELCKDKIENYADKCKCVQDKGTWCYIGDCPDKFKGGADNKKGWGRSGTQNATSALGFTYTGKKKWAYKDSALFEMLGLKNQ